VDLVGNGGEQAVVGHAGGDQGGDAAQRRLLVGQPFQPALALGQHVGQAGHVGRLPVALLAERPLLLDQVQHAHPEGEHPRQAVQQRDLRTAEPVAARPGHHQGGPGRVFQWCDRRPAPAASGHDDVLAIAPRQRPELDRRRRPGGKADRRHDAVGLHHGGHLGVEGLGNALDRLLGGRRHGL
jgi:hypothetical protein